MSYGEVDTLNMLFEKLDALLNESQGYYESFLDANTLYKEGKMSDKDFFGKMGDYLVACSALEFLSVKSMFELKKAIDRGAPAAQGAAMPPGVVPGASGIAGRLGTPGNPVGGAPPNIVSAAQGFTSPGTLPTPDPALVAGSRGAACTACGAKIGSRAKFCTRCGTRTSS